MSHTNGSVTYGGKLYCRYYNERRKSKALGETKNKAAVASDEDDPGEKKAVTPKCVTDRYQATK